MTEFSNPQLPSFPSADASDDPPAFGIIVYVSMDDAGVCRGRVANLECEPATGPSEPAVLRQIVTRCKAILKDATAAGQTPAWVDPPLAIDDGESKRFLPMHL